MSLGFTRRFVTASTLAAMLALAAAAIISNPVAAGGRSFVVRAVGDRGDHNIGDGRCDAVPGPGTTRCTLRAAIEEANSDPVADTIRFNITSGSSRTKVIKPGRVLPAITEPLTIDGYTQDSASPNTAATGTNAKLRVVLDGTDIPSQPGLQARARVTIRGLVISGFARGVQLSEDSDGSRVLGCFVGSDATGRLDRGNNGSGILVNARNVRIGSIARADRNLISGNNSAGVSLGIAARNAIVYNNLIGTRRGGRLPLANLGDGVFVTGSRGHRIGGTAARQGNVIANNAGNGVALLTVSSPSLGTLESHNVQVLGNSIFSNGGLAIDLGDDGRTRNDPVPDPDRGSNALQNFPRITSAVIGDVNATIRGELRTRRNAEFRLELFQSPAGDPEGRLFIGSVTVQTGGDGVASFRYRTRVRLTPGALVTATATDLARSQTSEVSPVEPVVAR
jgi:hypothetical protein